MAAVANPSFPGDLGFDQHLPKVILLQAHFRGYLIRKQFKDLRKVYEKIFCDFEPNSTFTITWKRNISCFPNLVKKKYVENVSQQSPEHKKMQSSLHTSLKNSPPPKKEIGVQIGDSQLQEYYFIREAKCEAYSQICDQQHSPEGNKVNSTYEASYIQVATDIADSHSKIVQSSKFVEIPLHAQSFRESCSQTEFNEYSKPLTKEDLTDVPYNKSSTKDYHDGLPKARCSLSLISADGSFTDVTSIWGSILSSPDKPDEQLQKASSSQQRIDSLLEQRKNVALELLWVQQAIQSRKNYLKLRELMKNTEVRT